MKRIGFVLIVSFLFCSNVFADSMSEINYVASNLGAGLWQYTYEVKNLGLADGIGEFTIWFDYGKYNNLQITTPNPPSSNWNQIVWQPDPVIKDAGGYDALANSLRIQLGQSVYGFAVSFNWLGTGTPGSQQYEIINPSNFQTIESSWTTPEPATLLLFGLGALFLRKRK
jgi:hypothetical protein